MLRALFGLVSLLAVMAIAVVYFTTAQPEVQPGTYKKIESQANAAAALMQNHEQAAQDQVDAASGDKPTAAATNAPASSN